MPELPRSRLNGQEADMVTRCLGGRLAGEPQRGMLPRRSSSARHASSATSPGIAARGTGQATHGAPFLNRGRPAALLARTMLRPQ
jgi:hypothetical protein